MLRGPGRRTVAHRLDPRTKLLLQVSFAVAAFSRTDVAGLLVLTMLAAGIVVGAGLPIAGTLGQYRLALLLLTVAPIVEFVGPFEPGFAVQEGGRTALASYRVLLILLVGAAFIHTTSLREARAAIQWFVPGRPGQVLGVGLAFVGRFLPLLRDDLRRQRQAMRARAGRARPRRERMRFLAVGGANRALRRGDRFADALKGRCFAWNPTLPALAYTRIDIGGGVLIVVLAAVAVLGVTGVR